MIKRTMMFLAVLSLLITPNAFARYDSYSYEYMNTEGVLYFDIINKAVSLKSSLGLSEEQVNKLKDLSLRMEKQHLKDLAEIRLAELELTETLKLYKVDGNVAIKQLNKLYDQKKNEKRNMVEGYVKSRSIFTKEQFEHLQDLLQMEYVTKNETAEKVQEEQRSGGVMPKPAIGEQGDDEELEPETPNSCATHTGVNSKKEPPIKNEGIFGDGSGDFGDGSGTKCSLGLKQKK